MSLCRSTPRSRQTAEISSIGWSTPVSLFAAMIETSVVSGRIAARSVIGIDQPVARNLEPRDLETFALLQMLERMQHRVMFRAVADQVLSVRREISSQPEKREIVRLRAAAGEDDLVRPHPQQRRQLIARIIDRRPRLATRRVHARGISEMPLEIWQHRLPRRRAERRRGVVIEVDHSTAAACRNGPLRGCLCTTCSWFSS